MIIRDVFNNKKKKDPMNSFYEWFINFKIVFRFKNFLWLNCKNCSKRVETNSSSGEGRFIVYRWKFYTGVDFL